jgi:hypothetical protein
MGRPGIRVWPRCCRGKLVQDPEVINRFATVTDRGVDQSSTDSPSSFDKCAGTRHHPGGQVMPAFTGPLPQRTRPARPRPRTPWTPRRR